MLGWNTEQPHQYSVALFSTNDESDSSSADTSTSQEALLKEDSDGTSGSTKKAKGPGFFGRLRGRKKDAQAEAVGEELQGESTEDVVVEEEEVPVNAPTTVVAAATSTSSEEDTDKVATQKTAARPLISMIKTSTIIAFILLLVPLPSSYKESRKGYELADSTPGDSAPVVESPPASREAPQSYNSHSGTSFITRAAAAVGPAVVRVDTSTVVKVRRGINQSSAAAATL